MISSFRTGDFQNTGQALSAHRYIQEFYLESAVRQFAENPDGKTDEKLESILSAVQKNEKLGMEILYQLQEGNKTDHAQKINEELDLDTFDHLL